MIFNILKQIMFLLLIFYLGVFFLKLFRVKFGMAEKISSGFMLGIGFSTFGLFLLGFIGYKFNFQNVFIFLTSGNILLILINKIFLKNSFGHLSFIKLIKSFDLIERILIGGIIFFLLTSLIRNLYWPIWSWDAVQLFDYRAKLIVLGQSVFFPAKTFYDISYPPLTSILHSIFYASGSSNPQFIYTFIFAALIMGVYAFTKNLSNRKVTLSLCFLISFYPLFYQNSILPLTDLVQSTFLVLGTFYLIKWLSQGKDNLAVLGGLFFAFSRFTRNEPVWIAALVFGIIYLFWKRRLFYKKSTLYLILFLVLNYFVIFVFGKYLASYSFSGGNLYIQQPSLLNQIFASVSRINLKTIIDAIVMVYNSVISDVLIPIVCLLIFGFVKRHKIKKETSILIMFCIFYLLMFLAGTLFYRISLTNTDFSALLGSFEGFSIFWKVLVFVLLSLVLYDYWTNFNYKNDNYKSSKL